MTQNGDIAAIREDVSHIARGCQSLRSHNPEVYQHSIDAALDRLAALLADAEKALREIAETSRWYADNGSRLAHEVDHALCVEILSTAEDAVAAFDAAGGAGE